MIDELMLALDDCLNAIASGATVEAAVARHPALADELRPMLEAALMAGASSAPVAVPRAEQMSSRAKFLARAAELRAPAPRRGFWQRRFTTRAWAAGLAVVLAFVVGTYGVVSASAPSLPGDALYGVKRTVEQVQLSLAPDPQTHNQLTEQFAARRVDEARMLIVQKREAEVEFRGRVENITGEQWSVAGLTVIVASGTRVNGNPALGVLVDVTGATQPDGMVQASAISVIAEAETPTPAEPVASATASPTATSTLTEPATPTPTESAAEDATETLLAPAPSGVPEPTAGVGIEFEFTGIVESIVGNEWRISGQAVTVTASTDLRGNPQVGQTVDVEAVRQSNGTLVALRIEVKTSDTGGPSGSNTPQPTEDRRTPQPTHTPESGGGSGPSPSNTPQPTRTPEPSQTPQPSQTPAPQEVEFEAILQSISGNVWTVGGQAVTVTDSTEIKDNPQVGDLVRVRALQYADGGLIAERIEKP